MNWEVSLKGLIGGVVGLGMSAALMAAPAWAGEFTNHSGVLVAATSLAETTPQSAASSVHPGIFGMDTRVLSHDEVLSSLPHGAVVKIELSEAQTHFAVTHLERTIIYRTQTGQAISSFDIDGYKCKNQCAFIGKDYYAIPSRQKSTEDEEEEDNQNVNSIFSVVNVNTGSIVGSFEIPGRFLQARSGSDRTLYLVDKERGDFFEVTLHSKDGAVSPTTTKLFRVKTELSH